MGPPAAVPLAAESGLRTLAMMASAWARHCRREHKHRVLDGCDAWDRGRHLLGGNAVSWRRAARGCSWKFTPRDGSADVAHHAAPEAANIPRIRRPRCGPDRRWTAPLLKWSQAVGYVRQWRWRVPSHERAGPDSRNRRHRALPDPREAWQHRESRESNEDPGARVSLCNPRGSGPVTAMPFTNWRSAALTFAPRSRPVPPHAGAHIRVKRRWLGVVPYQHHGIYVGDGEVVEFGGGRRARKGQVHVRRVSFDGFEQRATAESVSHPIVWMGVAYRPQLPTEDVLDRADWLLDNQPPRYRLGHRNCESIAIWCATGDFESFQVKAFSMWMVACNMVLLLVSRRHPRLFVWLSLVVFIATLLTSVPSIHSRALFDHARGYPGLGNWPR